jgi:HPt (histidine-containing phosphotransfer) domain-containing protein
MLIYNFQKEFLGIDEKDLKTLGFNTLSELRTEVTDFADLFVKTPGYVHNFKHVHWIDFVNYADVSEESKVLINVNSKTFKATLSVSTLFLIDNPASPAYIIHLNNLRPLSKSENDNLSSDVLDRELPKVEPQEPKVFTPTPNVAAAVHDSYDNTPPQQQIPEPEPQPEIEVPQEEPEEMLSINMDEDIAPIEVTPDINEPLSMPEHKEQEALDVGDLSLDVFEEEHEPTAAPTPEPEIQTTTPETPAQKAVKKVVKKEVVQEEWDNGYQYDPHIASKELGLPLDLIEEFIQDFIAQAKDFKPDIYKSIEEGDVDNVKILSHKLKGVAANLRIEDAHEVLAAVSATSEMDVIEENLNTFYKIIAKLAGEPIEKVIIVEEEVIEEALPETQESPEIALLNDDEEIALDIKEDNEEKAEIEDDDDFKISLDLDDEDEDLIQIEDDDVPQKIDMPELADDDFLAIENDEEESSADEATPVFSKAEAAAEIGLDEESFNELFDDFVNESHQIFQKIDTAIQNDDLQTCKSEALKFKGMSDNMRLHEFTNELETLIHSSDKDEIAAAAKKIDATISKISNIGA